MKLSTNNLFFSYNKDFILNDLSINFYDGLTTIVGENGRGKSTLLNLLNLVTNPTSGSIIIDDHKINNKTKHKKRIQNRKNINMVYQFSINQIFNPTVKEELIFNNKRDINTLDEEIYYYFKKLNLNLDLLTKDPLTLSGGQQKKISIITILLLKPRILLLDEPTIGLDNKSKKNILNILKEYSKKNKVIIVSHNMDDVFLYSDYVFSMDNIKYTKKIDYFYEQLINKNVYNLPNIFKLLIELDISKEELCNIKDIESLVIFLKERNELFI